VENTSVEGDDDFNNKIVKDIMKDVKKLEQFRSLQKIAYRSREKKEEDIELVHKEFNPEDKEKRLESQSEAFFGHQKAYVEICSKLKTLPLPLLKKVKFDTFILDNYQINTKVAKAFGETIHLLGSHLRKMKLLKNNLKDTEL
jgi:hypothetical protein